MKEPQSGKVRAKDLSRREFVRAGGLLVAAGALGLGKPRGARAEEAVTASIPRRVLGRTGVEVTILGLGTATMGHRNQNNPDLPPLVSVFSEAIDRGINYIDTGRIYGRAEEALGEVLRTRREKVFLVTKCMTNGRREAEESFETSLRKLGVDHVDLLHLHSTGDRDLDRVLAPGGVWDYFQKLKEQGKTRFLGLSGHSRPANFVRMIEETGQVDALLIAMNFVDRHTYGFEEKVLPVARKRGLGVMAMKVFGGIRGSFPNYSAKTPHPSQMEKDLHRDAIRYILSLEGITGMVIGVHDAEQLRRNIELVLAAKPLPPTEFQSLVEKGKALAGTWGPRFGPVA